ncbi:PEP-CTERM sorting domain-containing protein, partial [Aquincola sp. MAHUQ-54]
PGVNGGGTLASISFDVLRAGSSALNFSDVMLSNSNFGDITVTVQNGSVSAVPEPGTWLLFGLGLAALRGARSAARRRPERLGAVGARPAMPTQAVVGSGIAVTTKSTL